ncbi:hypothetical protein E2C01_029563 [Portunus trituberculatus]|uniref:Uncharacterized protein n=1 Tax=Portunus trituberculatus TaxID=210409 RepID=A0A5B7ESA3_PORTR|nr:hypothetical protein [Portunus trituberculatus]
MSCGSSLCSARNSLTGDAHATPTTAHTASAISRPSSNKRCHRTHECQNSFLPHKRDRSRAPVLLYHLVKVSYSSSPSNLRRRYRETRHLLLLVMLLIAYVRQTLGLKND